MLTRMRKRKACDPIVEKKTDKHEVLSYMFDR